LTGAARPCHPRRMCGRYSLTTPEESLVALFDAGPIAGYRPRYNVAPSQEVAAVRLVDGRRAWAWLRWGLIPSWAKDPAIGNRMINARAETVAEKPSFRAAFKARRCLIAASGFYEWRRSNGAKQPYDIGLIDGGPFAFAGLWERWRGADGEAVETCTILTTDAAPAIAHIHPRMPVILDAAHFDVWLETAPESVEMLQALLAPYPGGRLRARPVSRRVNDPRNDDPDCLAEIAA